jgi:hypothetical protein
MPLARGICRRRRPTSASNKLFLRLAQSVLSRGRFPSEQRAQARIGNEQGVRQDPFLSDCAL